MKQYRVTSADFVPKGEQGYPDAHMDHADLVRMKQLAGILVKEDYSVDVIYKRPGAELKSEPESLWRILRDLNINEDEYEKIKHQVTIVFNQSLEDVTKVTENLVQSEIAPAVVNDTMTIGLTGDKRIITQVIIYNNSTEETIR